MNTKKRKREKKYERKTYKIKKDIKDKNYNVMIIL